MHTLTVLLSLLVAPALAEDPGVTVAVEAPAAVVGQPAVVKVTLSAVEGFELNTGYTHRMTWTGAPAKVGLKQASVICQDGTEQAAGFEFEVSPKAAGEHGLKGELKYSVCQAGSCKVKTQAVTGVLGVK